MGDWNGDGIDTLGVKASTGAGPVTWQLRNTNDGGPADVTFDYGAGSDYPLTWAGVGRRTGGRFHCW